MIILFEDDDRRSLYASRVKKSEVDRVDKKTVIDAKKICTVEAQNRPALFLKPLSIPSLIRTKLAERAVAGHI